jgi:hypothetical protein
MYNPCTSSGSLAVGTTSISTMPGLVCNVVLNPGSAASSVTIYDNATAASGTVLFSLVGAASGSSIAAALSCPIIANKGITVVVAGTAATAFVGFTQGG